METTEINQEVLFLTERQLLGMLTYWAITQSPNIVLNNLDKALTGFIKEFNKRNQKIIVNDRTAEFYEPFFEKDSFKNSLNDSINSVPDMLSWNDESSNLCLVCRDSNITEGNYIELDKLVINVTDSLYKEYSSPIEMWGKWGTAHKSNKVN